MSALSRLLDPRLMTAGIGAGRVALGLGLLAKPVFSTTMLGLDDASARRIVWLARMAAIRDAGIGGGTLVAALTGRGEVGWLLAGAAADAGDALATGLAARDGVLDKAKTYPIAGGAAAGAVAACVAAAQLIRRRG